MVIELSNQSDLITLDKGAFYLFGVGTGLLIGVVVPVYMKVFKKESSKFLNVLLARLLFGGVVLTFALPQIVHFSVATYLEDQGYQICREKSHRWLHAVTIVYTKTLPCTDES